MSTRTATITRLALAVAVALLPVTAAFAQTQGATRSALTVPITGTIAAASTAEPPVPITGTFSLQRFEQQSGSIVAIGTLAATFTDATTDGARTIVSQVALPLDRTTTTAACPTLHLVLGPLDLNLLGLTEHLDQLVLDITAASGPGNPLGNLLCSVANLLNGTGASPVGELVTPLNQVLAALGG